MPNKKVDPSGSFLYLYVRREKRVRGPMPLADSFMGQQA